MTTENRKWPLVVLTVGVISAGAGVGGIFGLVAGGVYATFESVRHHWLDRWWAPLGTVLGGIGGAGAGWLWTLLVWRLRDRRGIRIVAEGVGWGILAGLAATAFLHASLWAAGTNAPEIAVPLVGFILAVPAGAVTGLACGCTAWGLAAWLRRGSTNAATEKPL